MARVADRLDVPELERRFRTLARSGRGASHTGDLALGAGPHGGVDVEGGRLRDTSDRAVGGALQRAQALRPGRWTEA